MANTLFDKVWDSHVIEKIEDGPDVLFIDKHFITKTGIQKILDKGMGAYYTQGSRPNQTKESWSYARLASVILYGPAFRIDKDIALKYGRKSWLDKHPTL